MTDSKEFQCIIEKIFVDLEKVHHTNKSNHTHFHLEKDSQTEIRQIIKDHTDKKNDSYQKRVISEIFENGPLEKILDDSSITEILINQHNSIWYEKNGKFLKLDDHFATKNTYHNFVQRICQSMGAKFDLNQPHTNGKWKNFRVHIIAPPLAKEIHLSMRNHSKNLWSLESLQRTGWCNKNGRNILLDIVSSEKNILVVGVTGSGKTSVLGALLKETHPEERVIIIEDVSEICSPNNLSIKLLTREDLNHRMKNYTLNDLIKQSLRMRPKRLVMGELRGGEAKDLLLMLSSGHKGSMATLHASSEKEALLRLEILIQMGAPQWSLNTIRHLIKISLDAVVLVGLSKGQRKLQSISKISSLEQHGLILEKIYTENSTENNE